MRHFVYNRTDELLVRCKCIWGDSYEEIFLFKCTTRASYTKAWVHSFELVCFQVLLPVGASRRTCRNLLQSQLKVLAPSCCDRDTCGLCSCWLIRFLSNFSALCRILFGRILPGLRPVLLCMRAANTTNCQ